MDTLTKQQRDILLDYYFECADQQETDIAKELLETHKGAIEFFNKLHHSLSALDHLDHEIHASCPDHLIAKTFDRLNFNNTETAAGVQLEKLLKAESEKIVTKRPSFWNHFVESVAIAAGVFIIASIFIPVTRQMRAQANKTACQANLAQVAQGITQYAGEHNGSLPAVATKAGNPWWKVGSTGQENQSNTRHLWLLVQQDYLRPQVFLCPGACNRNLPPLEKARILMLPDFPDRRYISYSFKLICDPNKAQMPETAAPLMSDTNPIFETCVKNPAYLSKPEFGPVKLDQQLSQINSSSHRGKGQNIMMSDGTVKFITQRFIDTNDDIFTVQNLDTYRGIETPNSETDVFLVP
ncbi:MAG: hypothetical protein ABSE89_00620 [Sedimentisphaerales bacterium]